MALNVTRRGAISAMALVPVAAAMPAAALQAGSSVFRLKLDAADAAKDQFNNLPPDLETDSPAEWRREMEAMIQTSRVADRAEPTTWREFARWLEHVSDEGCSAIDDDNAERLLSHTRRLAMLEG